MYINPYQNLRNGKFMKANFHTHAGTGAGTCGSNSIESVLPLYRQTNYEYLCISNHNLFTDTTSYSDDVLCMVPGVEYTKDQHMLNIGCDRSLHEHDFQEAIDITNKTGGFTIMAHPNWIHKELWKWDDLDKLKGYVGLEVINMLIYRLNGSGLATDTWDHLLTNGRLVYGFGNDDFHIFTDAARSFNLIYCENKSFDDMKAAVESGAFCASTGVYPEYLKLEGDTIKVKAYFPIDTYIDTFTYRFVTENGKILSEQKAIEGSYRLNGEPYVRVEVIGENGAMLFFQPVYKEGALKRI